MTNEKLKAPVSIEATLGACSQAGDARKADAYAVCFTQDGILQLAEKIEGQEAIRQWMIAPSVIPQPKGSSPGFVSHHLTTGRIELTSDHSAAARTYWLVITAMGVDHSGYYDDRFEKEGAAWLIAHRRPGTHWVSPASLIAGPATVSSN